MKSSSLSERFEAFVRTMDGFESIDVLLQCADPKGKKRADYLIKNRQIVIEQKVLKSNPVERPQNFVDKLANERNFKVFGTVSTHQVFAAQPDSEDLQRRLILDLARVVDDDVADADKQTKDTRTIFNIPDAIGILILLNENAVILQPDVIRYALANTFQKRLESGSYRYTANDGVILISEAHSLTGLPKQPAFPILPFFSPQKRRVAEVVQFSEQLMREWAAFNNAPLITVPMK